MMTQEQALRWVAALFSEPPHKVTPDTASIDIAEWDSLGMLTLLASLDRDFGIVLSDDEVQGMKRVADILEILRQNGKLE